MSRIPAPHRIGRVVSALAPAILAVGVAACGDRPDPLAPQAQGPAATPRLLSPPPTVTKTHPWVGRTIYLVSNFQASPLQCLQPTPNAVGMPAVGPGSYLSRKTCDFGSTPTATAQRFIVKVASAATLLGPEPTLVRLEAAGVLSRGTNLCLDVDNGYPAGSWAPVMLASCDGSPGQTFRLPKPAAKCTNDPFDLLPDCPMYPTYAQLFTNPTLGEISSQVSGFTWDVDLPLTSLWFNTAYHTPRGTLGTTPTQTWRFFDAQGAHWL